MTATVPTSEPSELRAGLTWVWDRLDLADYPSATWTLKYAFKRANFHFEATAAVNGNGYRVTIAASTTLAYEPGDYGWAAWVESGAEKYEVDRGGIEVLPAYAQSTAANRDDRSHARIVLDAIEAVLENRATQDQQEYAIGNRSLKRTPLADLLRLRDRYRAEVYAEMQKERAANGEITGRVVVRL